MPDDVTPDNPRFILAIDRRYHTKAGKGRGTITYYHEGKDEESRTLAVIPWVVTDAPKWNPEIGQWTNLLRWFERTKDLPGAREAYDAKQEPTSVAEVTEKAE